jgi:hypothetical protein
MTALAALSRTDRQRLLERLDEREDTRRLMTEPGSLAMPDEPVPLHRVGRDTTTETSRSSAASSVSSSAHASGPLGCSTTASASSRDIDRSRQPPDLWREPGGLI